MANRSSKKPSHVIIVNRKARHDYALEQKFEAGVVLEGWEVKSLRAGRVQLRDTYVTLKGGEAWLLGALITPLPTVSTHVSPEAQRTRKLLLSKKELSKLMGAVQQKGYTLVPVDLHWRSNKVKATIALAKGKQTHEHCEENNP